MLSFLAPVLCSSSTCEGANLGMKGFQPTSAITALGKALKTSANDLTPLMKNVIMFGAYMTVRGLQLVILKNKK